MALEKLKIVVEDDNKLFSDNQAIAVLYNPNQIQVQKSGWQVSSTQSKPTPNSSPATLTVDLFFDTSSPDLSQSFASKVLDTVIGPRASIATDVREHINRIFSLTNVRSKLNRPPICRLIWGGEYKNLYFKESVLFQGLLQQVTKTFTHFTSQGMPVRATLNCTFVEYENPQQQAKKLNLIDDPIRIIKQGETLSSIAQEEYGNSALWRVIADANRLVNPRQLEVGSLLTVPPLPRQGGR